MQAAKANEAAKAAEVQRIEGLTGEVARTRTAAEQAAGAFHTAQQKYFDASIRADTLQSQADLEAQNATDATNKAAASPRSCTATGATPPPSSWSSPGRPRPRTISCPGWA